MKFSIVKNDKSTFWDEVILGVIAILCLTVGVLLIIYKPNLGIIDSNSIVMIGVMIAFFGFMFVPCLIYRIFTNK